MDDVVVLEYICGIYSLSKILAKTLIIAPGSLITWMFFSSSYICYCFFFLVDLNNSFESDGFWEEVYLSHE